MPEEQDADALSVDDILAAEDIEEKWIDVPEWPKNGKPGRVKIRPLNLRQLSAVARRASRKNPAGQDEIDRELMVVFTLLEGMVMPKLTAESAKKLSLKSAGAVSRIAAAINALGVTPEAIDEADKSVWDEADIAVPVSVGARASYDSAPAASGNGHY